MRLHSLLLAASLSLAAACGTPPSPGDSPDGGGAQDGGGDGAAEDAGSPDAGAGPFDLPVPYALDAGAPITAANETWTWVEFAESRCANGTPTGLAVNLTNRSKKVLVYLQGGGSCWTAQYCAFGAAVHMKDTVGEATVLGEAQHPAMQLLFDRTRADNPFKDASFVYVPYCTGDLHSGTNVSAYNALGFTDVHHVGARNLDAYLRRLAPTFADADKVWLMGISAGGFGVTVNGWRFQKAFPNARVDVLDDAGPLVQPMAFDATYALFVDRWKPEFPPGCTGCGDSLAAVRTRALELMASPRRYALMSYLQDQTVRFFLGGNPNAPLPGPELEALLINLRGDLPANAKTFYVGGTTHVVSSTPNVVSGGVKAWDWVGQFASDAPAWDHAGP
ncbi:MAG: hypothetical protein FJ086_13350 [Deltaproteobacteria bacterium]|nr:hypothetical protein [Deltaproteobacteria bacterium]